MANDNHLFSVTCYNVTMIKQDYYNDDMSDKVIAKMIDERSLIFDTLD